MWKSLILITIVSSLTVTSQTFLKKGMKELGEIKFSGFYDFISFLSSLAQNKFVIVGIVITIIAALFWLVVISKLDLTVAFPISTGIFFILLFLSSWFFLGEAISVTKILGVAIIIFGVFLIA